MIDEGLTVARQLARSNFTALWSDEKARQGMTKSQARKSAYRWLARELGLPVRSVRIESFDAQQCRAVVEVCAKAKEKTT